MKKICFITTSRADFGMIEVLINEALKKKNYKIYLIISGNHNDKVFGKSIKEINLSKKLKIEKIFFENKNKKEDKSTVALLFSNFLRRYTFSLKKINPNIFISFGDRSEMLAATLAAYVLKIPIAHLAGGEKTTGSLDDGYRHCMTKLSNLHFATSKEHKKRIIQLGEDSKTVFNYGSLNRQKIALTNFFSKSQLEKTFDIKFYKKNILMTLHPENIDTKNNLKNLKLVLECLNQMKDTKIIITSPNADEGGIEMIKIIKNFIKDKKNFKYIKSFGSKGYLSVLKIVDGVIGNSSSGISEVPLFSIKSINLGNRQNGRELPSSVISCKFNKKIIIKNLYSLKRKKNNIKIKQKDKIVAKKILKKIINFNFEKTKNKIFNDLKFIL